MDVARFGKGFRVCLPDAVNDRRLARIGGRAMVELAAQVDDSHPALSCSWIFGRVQAIQWQRCRAKCDLRLPLRSTGNPRSSGPDPNAGPRTLALMPRSERARWSG